MKAGMHYYGACGKRQLLHQLCRWLLPLAFALAIVALSMGGDRGMAMKVLATLLLACPVVCIVLLLRESDQVKQAVDSVVREKGEG